MNSLASSSGAVPMSALMFHREEMTLEQIDNPAPPRRLSRRYRDGSRRIELDAQVLRQSGRTHRACGGARARVCLARRRRDPSGDRAGAHGGHHRHRLPPLHPQPGRLRPDDDRVHLGRRHHSPQGQEGQAVPHVLRQRASHFGATVRQRSRNAGRGGARRRRPRLRPGGP